MENTEIRINRLPSLTWNRLRLNDSEVMVKSGFSRALPNEGFNLPEGLSHSEISNKELKRMTEKFREINPKECLPAGKVSIYTEKGIQTGIGSELTDLLDRENICCDLITLDENVCLDEPIHIRYDAEDGANIAARQVIYAKAGSSAKFIIDYITEEPHGASGNFMISTIVVCGEGASVDLAKVQLLGDGFTNIDDTGTLLGKGAHFSFIQTESGSGEVYSGCFVNQSGDRSEFKADLAYLCTNGQKFDANYVALQHGRKTSSDINVNGVLMKDSRKIFRGTIDFRRGSSGSTGNEQENTLLLSSGCINRTIPLILCEEEDVEGRHGATIGRLPDDIMFYFESRGISEKEAMEMATKARLGSVYRNIQNEEVKKKIHDRVEEAFLMGENIRGDFPIFRNDKYIYFDNAATTQRPLKVLDAERDFYETSNANPLRGLYEWSIKATEIYEECRHTVAEFIGAGSDSEIIFTRNTTESVNLVAYSYALENLKKNDSITISIMEHHSNMLPWQMAARKTGAELRYLECLPDGTIPESEIEKKITKNTKIVAIAHVSNVLGCTNDVKKIAEYAHSFGAVVLVDGAQSIPHMKVNVRELGADFFAFSGHKMLSPMGIGVLYGRKELLEDMPPFMTGGEMIDSVSVDGATFAEVPTRFEAGTVNAGGAAGLGEAVHYIENIGYDNIAKKDRILTKLAMEEMSRIPHVRIYGSEDPDRHCGIVAFNIDGCHPHDVASVLDSEKIAIRAGHHCAQPLMKHLGLSSTARASFWYYNTEDEIMRFCAALSKIRSWLGYND